MIIMLHYRKTKLTYDRHRKNDIKTEDCPFCTTARMEHIIEENGTMFIVANRVSYDMFEGRRVHEHLMVIPKAHRASIVDFTVDESRDFMSLVGKYEALGYNVYARGFDSPSRSVKHQHTHLIKLADKASSLVIYSKKPYLLIDY